MAPVVAQTAGSFECSVCPSGSSMTNSTTLLYFLTNAPLTCAQLQTYVANASSALDCIKRLSVMAQYPVNTPAFCGCTGVQSQRTCRPFCSTGLEVVDPTKQISILGAPMTCEQASVLNDYVNSTEWCSAINLDASPQCCFVGGSGGGSSSGGNSPGSLGGDSVNTNSGSTLSQASWSTWWMGIISAIAI